MPMSTGKAAHIPGKHDVATITASEMNATTAPLATNPPPESYPPLKNDISTASEARPSPMTMTTGATTTVGKNRSIHPVPTSLTNPATPMYTMPAATMPPHAAPMPPLAATMAMGVM